MINRIILKIKKLIKRVLPQLLQQFILKLLQQKQQTNIDYPKIVVPRGPQSHLSYARLLPKPGEIVFGGRVKLVHLGEIFPEIENKYNILYLVSSCLPQNAEGWLQRSKEAGVRIVWNQNGVGYPAWAGDDYYEVNKPFIKLMHQVDYVIYQSQFCKFSADKHLGEFRGPSAIIYNCVDTEVFTPRNMPLPESPLRLLVMGSHEQPERITLAICALKLILQSGINATLKIAGRLTWPEALNETEALMDSLGLNDRVILSGPYLQIEAPNLYREAHVLLHLKYKDPCPTVPIESMSCGIPVIASQSGGMSELLGEEGGITIPIADSWEQMVYPQPEEVAKAVIKMSKNWKERSILARERAINNFDKKHWQEEHKSIFSDLLR